jgi:hypothetical protein
MDSSWIASFLAFAHTDKGVAPAPGPCKNHRLLEWDFNQQKYVGRFGLIMASKEFGGDYRRVTEAQWKQFVEFYPGSGPEITMEFLRTDANETGVYDTSKWIIKNPPPPPVVKEKKFKKKNEKKADANKPAADVHKEEPGRFSDDATTGLLAGFNPPARRNDSTTNNANTASLLGITKNEPKTNYKKLELAQETTKSTAETALLSNDRDDENASHQRDGSKARDSVRCNYSVLEQLLVLPFYLIFSCAFFYLFYFYSFSKLCTRARTKNRSTHPT